MEISKEEWRKIQLMQVMAKPVKNLAKYLKVTYDTVRCNGLTRLQTKEAWICRVNEMRRYGKGK